MTGGCGCVDLSDEDRDPVTMTDVERRSCCNHFEQTELGCCGGPVGGNPWAAMGDGIDWPPPVPAGP